MNRLTPRSTSATLFACALLAVLAACAIPALSAAAKSPSKKAVNSHAKRAAETSPLFRSRLLWATIDVCNPGDQPNTVGIRGSMPGDHQPHDTMYMRFRLQYMDSTTKAWTDLSKATGSFAAVGSGAAARQAGRSFQLNPVAGQPPFTLRGVVSFQWRHGAKVLEQISRTTSAGRQSLAGSDPAGFSAATCAIG